MRRLTSGWMQHRTSPTRPPPSFRSTGNRHRPAHTSTRRTVTPCVLQDLCTEPPPRSDLLPSSGADASGPLTRASSPRAASSDAAEEACPCFFCTQGQQGKILTLPHPCPVRETRPCRRGPGTYPQAHFPLLLAIHQPPALLPLLCQCRGVDRPVQMVTPPLVAISGMILRRSSRAHAHPAAALHAASQLHARASTRGQRHGAYDVDLSGVPHVDAVAHSTAASRQSARQT